MAWNDIFKSDDERKRDRARQELAERREREKNRENLQIQRGRLANAISSLEKRIDDRWDLARKYLSEGRRDRAQRELLLRKKNEGILHRFLNLQYIVEFAVDSSEFLTVGSDFLVPLKNVVSGLANIDGIDFASELDRVTSELEGKVRDVGEAIDMPYNAELEREMFGVYSGNGQNGVATVEDDLKLLEKEIALGVTGGSSTVSPQTELPQTNDGLRGAITAGSSEIDKQLAEMKKNN
ncbi:MAG: hypothetical protein Q4G03_04740 [Planctomycetia bacterium]|nr:hypothetical protein [Planctomycetia bacterium]